MEFFELPSTKMKLSLFFAGQWSSGMIHTKSLRVQEVPGSKSLPAVPFSFLVLTLCFKRRHEPFRVVEQQKKTFGIACGTVVQWYDSRLGCERSRVQFPAVPFSLMILKLCFKRRHEFFRVVEQQKEIFGIFAEQSSSGMILALDARCPGFNSRMSPFDF